MLDTLEELGVRFPADFLTDPTITAARNTIVGMTGQLDGLIEQVAAAIEADDAAGIVAAGAAVITQIGRIGDAIPEFVSAVQSGGAALPGITAAQITDLTTDLARKITDLVLADLLELSPGAGAVLTVLGIVDRTPDPGDPTDPTRPPRDVVAVHLDRVLPALTNPVAHLKMLYGWGGALDVVRLLTVLEGVLARLGLPVLLLPGGNGTPPQLQAFGLDLQPTPDGTGLALSLVLRASVDTTFDFPVSPPAWTAHVAMHGELDAGTSGRLQPPFDVSIATPNAQLTGAVTVGLTAKPADPLVVLGQAGGSRLEFAELSVDAGLALTFDPGTGSFTAAPTAAGEITGGKLVIDTSSGDGFVATLLGGARIDSDFGVGFGFAPDTGLKFHGSGALEIAVPVHVELGPIEIQTVYLAAKINGAAVPVELSAGLSAHMGPITASVDRLGVVVNLGFPPGGGNIGPADVAFAFKPPNGVGLELKAGLVAGGGYLYADPDRGEYAGALELEFAQFLALKAIGLITTRMPDGSRGFSLLGVITAEFGGTGIQLGYGFTLLGVGGILGLNRGVNLQALAEGVRTGAVESVMFPTDVVANAPRILSDLRAFFPPQQGTFLIGPMAKIGWGTPTLVSVSLGVVIEIPGNTAILGVLKVVLPTEELALLVLQVDFAGALEFDKQRLWFVAELFDSRILTMTLSGGMGLLVAWGDSPDVVLTVGGFHPSYMAPPLPFPVPDRLSVDILNQPNMLIRVSGYFAVTSNTVQFGATAQLRLGFDDFGIEGHLSFDALFQFSPFRFVISISAGMSLKAFGVGLFSIDLQFQLEGPSPWRAHGRGSVGLLFFEISADFDIAWGEARDTTLTPVDVLPLLANELSKLEGWRTQLPAGRTPLVTLRTLPPTNQLVLHPLGTLIVRQRAVPLDIRVDKIGGQRAHDGKRFSVTPAPGSGLRQVSVAAEKFAIAQFQDLTDAQKLSLPSYGDQDAGVELAGATGMVASARVVRRSARFEMIVLDSRGRASASLVRTPTDARPRTAAPRAAVGAGVPAPRKLTSVSPAVYRQLLAGSSTSRSPLSRQDADRRQPFAAQDTIRLSDQRFIVAYVRNNVQAFPPSAARLPTTDAGGAAVATFRSQAAAADALADWVARLPNLAGTLHVIPAADASVPLAVPGTWSTAGGLPAPTAGAPAVRLASGRVLLAGGAGAPSAAALFDPVANLWTAAGPLHTGRENHAAVLLADGRPAVLGGRAGDPLASVEVYNATADTWSTLGTGLHTARHGHSATVLADGRVLVAGGTGARGPTGSAALASAEILDPATDTWTSAAPMHDARSGHEAVLLQDGRVLVVGGALLTGGPRRPMAYCELFDPTTGTWAPTGELATARISHQATLLADGTVLVTGGDPAGDQHGRIRADSLNSAEQYDPTTGQWTPVAPMPGPFGRHRAVLLRTGLVLISGGTSGPTFTAGYRAAATYNPGSGRWTATGALADGRWAHTVVELADGRIVVTGGVHTAAPAAVGPASPVFAAGTEIFTP
ncbi:hypothetical protein LWC33_29540 [Pseudonocardia sp. RS11V-5]|uniref:DUF6603 domain-containing protein n=1 Tax=Pseudonocardia terrae TaxID=2905831 RepID=UPI001E475C67|nr:DUF6603 domain-containing protein [Pseudonocardia terrae]MCE3555575.1 hypothetical protein [Pseudonocardia terrae]